MIYCVEDDFSICEMELFALRSSGFEAEGFGSAAELQKALEKQKPDLILLDIMLPDDDGVNILKRMRMLEDTKKIPVILATAKGTESDKVLGLDSGADDYLAKPFGMREMISRIRAVLRRTSPETEKASEILTLSEIRLDPSSRTVSVSGEPIDLSLKEFELLRLLLSHQGRVFTRDELLENIWSGTFPGETRTVDVHIASLRQKLGTCSDCIRTVRGVGYRMEAAQ